MLLLLIIFVLVLNAVYAIQAIYSGTVTGVFGEDIVVARADGNNFMAEIKNSAFSNLIVEGSSGSEVEFYLKNKIVKRALISEGVQTIQLDASISLPPKEVVIEKKIIVEEKPEQIPLPPKRELPKKLVQEKKPEIWPYILIMFFILALAAGVFLFLKKHQVKMEEIIIPKIPLKPLPKKEKIISEKISVELPPEIQLGKPPFAVRPEKPALPKEPLVTQEDKLRDYIKEMREKGFSDAQIKAALYARGWKKEIIDKVF